MRDLIKIADAVGRTIEGVIFAKGDYQVLIALSGNAMAVIRSDWYYDYAELSEESEFFPGWFPRGELLKLFEAELVGSWFGNEV